jgi:polynucleotide 5'-kinase involved in rRNA processing
MNAVPPSGSGSTTLFRTEPKRKLILFENMKTTALFRPMVMLVGQYSTGKTTFIRYLLEQDFPGIRIGPEPTTDRYVVL